MRATDGLIRDRRGATSILTGFALTMLLGSAALAVDVGALYLDRRKLQGIADAAALAAAARPGGERAAAERIIEANCNCGIEIAALETGFYTADTALDADRRFVGGLAPANAVRIQLVRARPLFFGRFVTGRDEVEINVTATGARRGYAAFSLGSRVAGVRGGVPNALLSALTGSTVQLSAMDYEAMASSDIDLLAFSDALRTEVDAEALTFGQTLDSRFTLPQIMTALARSGEGRGAQAIGQLAARAEQRAVIPAHAIDLGPRASAVRVDPANPVRVNMFDLLRAMLFLANGERQLDFSLAAGLPGGQAVDVALVIGDPAAQSPLIAITDSEAVVVRTSQMRIKLDTRVQTPVARVDIPLIAELGSASAQIARIDCHPGRGAGVDLAVTTSPATFAIAEVDAAALRDLRRPIDYRPAPLVSLPLVRIDGRAEMILSDQRPKTARFSRVDIAAGVVRRVASSGVASGATASLGDKVELTAHVRGIGVNAQILTKLAGDTLAQAAPSIDAILDDMTGFLGVHVGEADARVNALRCGRARLV